MDKKFNELDKKKKIEHIWYYYKIHIIVSIIILVVLVQTITGIINRKTSILGVDLIGTAIASDKVASMEKDATTALTSNVKEQVDINFLQYDKKGDTTMNSATRDKLTVTIAAGDLDVVVMDKDMFLDCMSQGYFLKLNDIKELSDLEKSGYQFVKGQSKEQGDSSEYIYGIDIDKCPALKSLSFSNGNKVIGIIANTKRKDTAVKFIQWLIREK